MNAEEYWTKYNRYAADLEVEYERVAKGFQSQAESLMAQFDKLSADVQAAVILKLAEGRVAELNYCADRGNSLIKESQTALVKVIRGEPNDYWRGFTGGYDGDSDADDSATNIE